MRDIWRLLSDTTAFLWSTSVLDRHAFDVVFLEILASSFRCVFVESGKTGAVKGGTTFIDCFGEGFRAAENFRRFALHAGEALLGGLLGGERAYLDHPARVVLRFCRGRPGFGSRRRRGGLCLRHGGLRGRY